MNIQFNKDDGIFLGAGFIYTKEGWRKDPFEQKHQLKGNAAFATGAINLNYSGVFTDVVGSWDLVADLSLQQPYSVSNFFGFGNETDFDFEGEGLAASFDDPIDFYRVRYNRSNTFLGLGSSLGVSGNFEFGVQHLSFGLDETADNKFIGDPTSGVDATTLDDSYHFLGFKTELNLDNEGQCIYSFQGCEI